METRNCQNCKNDFTIESEDFAFYEKIKVPPPTFCFQCRLQRKMAYINERTLFKRECDNCRKSMISVFPADEDNIVWCSDCFKSDDKDEYANARDYDFSVPFFVQFHELSKKVPRLHMTHKYNNAEGCEYANYTYRSRNVYLSFDVVRSEDIYYSKHVMRGNKVCLDSLGVLENERGYELVDASGNYNSRFLLRSSQCIDSAFLVNCRNCTNCCLSANMSNKSYVFRGIQLTKEAYAEAIELLKLHTYSGQEHARKEFLSLQSESIQRYSQQINCVDCTGNGLENSKNVKHSFEVIDSENAKYIGLNVTKMSDSYDLLFTGKMESCYEVANAGALDYHVFFSLDVGASNDVWYSTTSNNCGNLFGCAGMYGKQYCILNKQYTQQEYEALVPKIIEHMNTMPYVDPKGRIYRFGEYFPTDLSCYPYNNSLAYEEFPLSEQEVAREGYSWQAPLEKSHAGTIESVDIADSINDVTESILQETIGCPNKGRIETQCTSAYRITSEELRMYKLMKIPIPRHCPNCRYFERKKQKLPWKLWHRSCMCDQGGHGHEGTCANKFETSYAPERPEKIYCESCYQKEVM